MNCNTGFNDCAGFSDLGALMGCVIPLVAPAGTLVNGGGGEIDFRGGFFAVSTAINLGGVAGLHLKGTSVGQYVVLANVYGTGTYDGTVFVAKTAGMTMLENSASPTYTGTSSGGCSPALTGMTIENIFFDANGYAARGIWDAQCRVSSDERFVNLILNGIYNCLNPPTCNSLANIKGFSTAAMNLDGCDTCYIIDSFMDGDTTYGATTWGNQVDVHWFNNNGAAYIENTKLAGAQSLIGSGGTFQLDHDLVDSQLEFTNTNTPVLMVQITNSWNSITTGTTPAKVLVDAGTTIDTFYYGGDNIAWTATIGQWGGTGTVNMFSMSHNLVQFTGSCTWNPGGATITNSKSTGDNWVFSGSACTGFPYTVTSSVF